MIALYILTTLNFLFISILTCIILYYFGEFKKEQLKYKKFLKLNNKFIRITSECINNIQNYIQRNDQEDIMNISNPKDADEIAEHLINVICEKRPEQNLNHLDVGKQPLSFFLCVHCSDKYIYKLVEKGLDLNKRVGVISDKKGRKKLYYPLQFLIDMNRLDVIKNLYENNKLNLSIDIKKETTAYEYCIKKDKNDIAEFISQQYSSETDSTLINKKRLN